MKNVISRALDSMPEPLAVVVPHAAAGDRFSVIGKRCGISAAAARQRWCRARQCLRTIRLPDGRTAEDWAIGRRKEIRAEARRRYCRDWMREKRGGRAGRVLFYILRGPGAARNLYPPGPTPRTVQPSAGSGASVHAQDNA